MDDERQEKPKKTPLSPFAAMELVWDILIRIAAPTVGFGLLGRWLDRKYESEPWFTIIGLILSLAVVALLVVKKSREIAKRL